MIFCSYDTPDELSVNLNDYEGDDFDNEDDDEFDESLKQFKTKKYNFRESFRLDKSKLLTEKKKPIKEELSNEQHRLLLDTLQNVDFGVRDGKDLYIFNN